MKVELIQKTGLEGLYRAYGTCQKSSNVEKVNIQKALDAGHTSLLEHINYIFDIEGISRACSHQLVRHRIASYAQESQRYVKISGDDWYVVPPNIVDFKAFHSLMHILEQSYKEMIDRGVPIEDARAILPNCTKTKLVMTINARSLDNFFTLRLCKKAQSEIRELAQTMYKLVCDDFFWGAYPKCGECKNVCRS